jgi:hypothetical protein
MKLFRKRKSIDEIVGKALEIEERWQDMDRQNAHDLYRAQQAQAIRVFERSKRHRILTRGRRVNA